MRKSFTDSHYEKIQLLEELYHLYGKQNITSRTAVYLRKKYSWLLVVEGMKLIKRFTDIVVSFALLLLLRSDFCRCCLARQNY